MTPSSGIEFLVWLLIATAIIAMLAKRLRIPCTVSLVLGGLLLGVIQLPILSPLQPSPNRQRALSFFPCLPTVVAIFRQLYEKMY